MKAVILAGGLGSRLSEETAVRPKPLVELGGLPILWHIMKIYGHYGFTEFIVCLGYKGYLIKEFFSNYFLHLSDVTFDLANDRVHVHKRVSEPWQVTLVETGDKTQTGGRLKRVLPYIGSDEVFARPMATASRTSISNANCAFIGSTASSRPSRACGPPKDSVFSISKAMLSGVSSKNRKTKAAGSTVAFFSFPRASAI